MLNDFCHKDGALSKALDGSLYAAPIIEHIAKRVEEFRNTKDVIFWPQDAHKVDDKEFDRFPPHAVIGTWCSKIIDELKPHIASDSPFEMWVLKTRYSAFYNTDLSYQLQRLNPDVVEVCGVCTSICVMDTVGGLANRDYAVEVIKHGVADFDPAAHNFALSRMVALYGAKLI